MNRRELFRRTISVMAIAATLKFSVAPKYISISMPYKDADADIFAQMAKRMVDELELDFAKFMANGHAYKVNSNMDLKYISRNEVYK